MEIKRGIAVTHGISIRPAFVLDREGYVIPKAVLDEEAVEAEAARLEQALVAAQEEVVALEQEIADRLGDQDIIKIFAGHRAILEDTVLREKFLLLIREEPRYNAEYAVSTVMRGYAKQLEAIDDEYLSQRVGDIKDVERRILRLLLREQKEDMSHLQEEVVVIARDLTPSETAALDRSKVLGFATDAGGRTSHTAIVARALGIPAVVGLETVTADVTGGDTVIVDGNRGLVIVNPDESTLEKYREREREIHDSEERTRQEVSGLPAVTPDGRAITLLGNIETPDEVAACVASGAEGIGLYRTEFLFLGAKQAPTERDHFDAYLRVVHELGGAPVIFRTLDLGADKAVVGNGASREANPFLGCRSIRYCLKHRDVFKTQLRAILRVSAFGNVKIMFPLISTLDELNSAKALLQEVMEELDRDEVPFDHDIDVGIMIEVPSAAIIADILAPEVDFFSIGTNDLVQYCLAVDRDNESVAHLYSPAHPAILRLLRMTIAAAEKRRIPVSMCGEMAGDLLYMPLLVGLGLREFSVSPPSIIPEMKKCIRSISFEDAREIAEKACSFADPADTMSFLEERTRTLIPEFF